MTRAHLQHTPKCLYHYTCKHAAPRIQRDHFIIPIAQPVLSQRATVRLSWFTDLDVVDNPEALGLQSTILNCTRTEYRFTVIDTSHIISWRDAAARMIAYHLVTPERVLDLEVGRTPSHWFVATVPVRYSEFILT